MIIIRWFILLCFIYVSCEMKSSIFVCDRLALKVSNQSVLNANARISKVNRTSFALNANFTILQDFEPVSMDITVFALYGNEYKQVPINIKKKLCDIYKLEYKWIEKELEKHSDMPKCHIKKGYYYIKDYVPDTSRFPFVSPWEHVKFRFRFYFTESKADIAIIDIMAHVNKSSKIKNNN